MVKIYERMFSELITKEKKLESLKILHAKEILRKISAQIEEEEKNATIIKKIGWFIKDFFSSFRMKKLKKIHEIKISTLTEEDKKEKIIVEKKLKKDIFILNFCLKRGFEHCHLIDECGSVDLSDIKYNVSLYIKYNNIISKKHYEKKFEKEDDALKYYNTLINKHKNQTIEDILLQLTTNIDKEFKKLNNKIPY